MSRKRKELDDREDREGKKQPQTPPLPPPPELALVACVLCKGREALIGYSLCKHKVYCLTCFDDHNVYDEHRPISCKNCDQQGWGRFLVRPGNPSITAKTAADRLTNDESADLLAAALRAVIDTCANLRLPDSQHIESAFVNQYQLFALTYMLYPLLKVDQCENLLTAAKRAGFYEMKSGYKLRNILVSFCRYPWLVSVDIGSHGVCYHGNMGELPDICKAVALTRANIDYAMGNKNYF